MSIGLSRSFFVTCFFPSFLHWPRPFPIFGHSHNTSQTPLEFRQHDAENNQKFPNQGSEDKLAPVCTVLVCSKTVAPTVTPLAYLDVEAAQYSVDAEQVSNGVVYVAVQSCIGDRSP